MTSSSLAQILCFSQLLVVGSIFYCQLFLALHPPPHLPCLVASPVDLISRPAYSLVIAFLQSSFGMSRNLTLPGTSSKTQLTGLFTKPNHITLLFGPREICSQWIIKHGLSVLMYILQESNRIVQTSVWLC